MMRSPFEAAARRRPRPPTGLVAGWLLGAMLALAAVHGIWPRVLPAWPAGLAAWGAGALLWRRIPGGQRVQAAVLAALGLAALVFALARGAPFPAGALLSQNQTILAMLAAVSFLRLVNRPLVAGHGADPSPVGVSAMLRTLLGTHLFGAVINLSSVVIIGDGLSRDRPLEPRAGLLLSRGFSCAVFYSPFFGGMALALAYNPGSSLPAVMAAGIPVAAAALALTAVAAGRGEAARDFRGYPIRFESLWIPATLAAGVLAVHAAGPGWSVLTVIAVLAPCLVGAVLVLRHGARRAASTLAGHVGNALPEMRGELVLFLAAGVLAVGLSGALATTGAALPLARFDAWAATGLLLVMVAVAVAGVHPVVSVAAAAPLVAPLGPDPDLLAVTFVMGWGVGVVVSPFSGTHLTISGRYGVDNRWLARRNLLYGAVLMTLCAAVLHLYHAW